jgi:AcrR family transcriptional regulator
MDTETTARLPGRQSEAARNDRRILEAARDVFTADPKAPISAVAERAGVGISALYRRYRSKEELLQELSLNGLRRYIDEVEAALADDGDPWDAFAAFMRRAVAADTSSLTLHLAGTFTPTEAHWRDGEKAFQLNTRLLDRTKSAGVLRQEFGVGDLSLVFEQLAAIKVGDQERTAQLRQRYLALLLDGLRDTSAASLPGSPPSWEEISRRWEG